MLYKESTILRGEMGNNKIAFQERKKLLGRDPELFRPSLVKGGIEDIEQGDRIVFEDVEEGRVLC